MFPRLISRVVKPLRQRLWRASEAEYRRLEQMMGFSGQYKAHRAMQMQLLLQQGVRPDCRVLEIGCGPLTLGIPLITYLTPGGYTGIDVRPAVVSEAKSLIVKQGLTEKLPRVLVSTSFGEQELTEENFDAIVAFSVLYHLEDDMVTRLLLQVGRRLASNAAFYANVNTEHSPSRWLEFPFVQRPLSFYSALARASQLEMTVLGKGHELGIPDGDVSGRNFYLRFAKLTDTA